MAVPSGDLGDLLVTDRTEAVLLFPQVTEPAPPFQSGLHIHVETFFKIRFPGQDHRDWPLRGSSYAARCGWTKPRAAEPLSPALPHL